MPSEPSFTDELRAIDLPRAVRGYDRDAVERLIEQAAAAFGRLAERIEALERDRQTLAEAVAEMKAEREERTAYVARLEGELARYRDLERSLSDAIVAAQREAGYVLERARAEARQVVDDAVAQRERLLADVRMIQKILASAATALDEVELVENDSIS